MEGPVDGASYFHVGYGVDDLDRAQAELGAGLGLDWGPTVTATVLGRPLRIAVSRQGPPYHELIEAPAGSPWLPAAGLGMVHLGFWSRDLPGDRDRMLARGYEIGVDGTVEGYPFVYLRPRGAGPWIELTSRRDDRMWRDHEAWASSPDHRRG